jgi:hypothetical protein
MAYVIPTRGSMRRLQPFTGATFTIHELARYVETLAQWRHLQPGDEVNQACRSPIKPKPAQT